MQAIPTPLFLQRTEVAPRQFSVERGGDTRRNRIGNSWGVEEQGLSESQKLRIHQKTLRNMLTCVLL
jgi:hypothetical protein